MFSPVIVKLGSETVACEMVRLAVPGLVSVIVWVLVVPTTALPKLTLGGVTESWGCTPVPLRAMVLGELGALLTSETLPDTLPVAVGDRKSVEEGKSADVGGSGIIRKIMLKPPAPVRQS